MKGGATPPREGWMRGNTALLVCAVLTGIGALAVFSFGVLWTHGVYGSRMAWLLGVVLPLLAVTAVLALSAARLGTRADPAPWNDRRNVARGLGVSAVALVGIPVVFAAMILLTYALLFVVHFLR